MSTPPRHWHELPGAPEPGCPLLSWSDLPDPGAHLLTLPAPTGSRAFSLLLLRRGDELHAFANRCAHFGVPLASRQEHLIAEIGVSLTCNVHYARFRWSDGVCDRGDCLGERLLAVPVLVDAEGMVRIAPGDIADSGAAHG